MAEGAFIAAQDAGVDVSQILIIGIDALPTPDRGRGAPAPPRDPRPRGATLDPPRGASRPRPPRY